MSTRFPMPIQEAVRDLIADLVGRAVAVSKIEPPERDVDAYLVFADYVTDDDEVGVVCVADLGLVASAGAALTLVPAAVAEESVRKKTLGEEMLLENFREIVNVMARLFNSGDTPHVRSRSVYEATEELPSDVLAIVEQPSARRDLGITVEGYGSGALSLFVS